MVVVGALLLLILLLTMLLLMTLLLLMRLLLQQAGLLLLLLQQAKEQRVGGDEFLVDMAKLGDDSVLALQRDFRQGPFGFGYCSGGLRGACSLLSMPQPLTRCGKTHVTQPYRRG